jgi:hypothetical protein
MVIFLTALDIETAESKLMFYVRLDLGAIKDGVFQSEMSRQCF